MAPCRYCRNVYVLDMSNLNEPLYPNIAIERDHAKSLKRMRPEAHGRLANCKPARNESH